MQFLYPNFLYGLFLLLIPLIIHLFKLRRYRTVYFSNTAFLEDVQNNQKNRARLRDLLLLLFRMLFIIFLVLVFAQPVKNESLHSSYNENQLVIVFIDPSLSMTNLGTDGILFDEAKKEAYKLVESLSLSTRFVIIDPDFTLSRLNRIDRYAAIEAIRNLQLREATKSMIQLIEQVNEVVDNTTQTENPVLYIFSDFQKSFIPASAFKEPTEYDVVLTPMSPNNTSNLVVDSCWLAEPILHMGARVTLNVRIENRGSQNYSQLPIQLFVNDSLMGQQTAALEAGRTLVKEIGYQPAEKGWQKIRFSINDYPVEYDNQLYACFPLSEKSSICQLYINQANAFISAAFSDNEEVDYISYPIGSFPERDFNRFDCVFLNEIGQVPAEIGRELVNYAEQGGSICFFPAAASRLDHLNDFLKLTGSPQVSSFLSQAESSRFSEHMSDFYREISLNPEEPVAWPITKGYYRFTSLPPQTRAVLETVSGRPLLVQTKLGNGVVNFAAFPLNESFTSLPYHPIFLPTLYWLSTGQASRPLSYARVGSGTPYLLYSNSGQSQPFELFMPDEQKQIIPVQFRKQDEPGSFISIPEEVKKAGFVIIKQDQEMIEPLAINNPKTESIMEFADENQLHQLISESEWARIHLFGTTGSEQLKTSKDTDILSLPSNYILALLALLCLLMESLFFRFRS